MNKALKVAGKIVLAMGICFLLSIIFNLVMSVLVPDPDTWPKELARMINVPKSLFVVLGAVMVILYLVERGREWQLGFESTRKISLSIAGLLMGSALVLATFVAIYFAGEAQIISYSMQSAIWIAFAITGFTSLCDTISEEVLFRGYLQGMIKSAYGSWAGIIISAIPFALLHSLGHDVFSNPLILINLALGGLFLALLREVSGSLWMPMGAHLSWNWFNDVVGVENSFVIIELGQNELISGGIAGFSKGLANTFIMVFVIAVLAYRLRLKGERTLQRTSYL